MSDAKKFYYEKKALSNVNSQKSLGTLEGYLKQKIDHNNQKDQRYFRQRYYINTSYAKNENSPVFYYICGESSCEKSRVERGQIIEMARRFQGYIVALEHRYYGQSHPFKDLKTKNLVFLNIDQAIKDLYYFQKYLQEEKNLLGKYIMVGGSYPGNLAAIYRTYYPNMTVGALASSAPVLAKENFKEYDGHLANVVSEKCLENIHQVNSVVENSLDNKTELDLIKQNLWPKR